jgi:CRISPR-associated protein Csx10
MIAIPYTVVLEQPLLATTLLGDPNSSVSYDYIPGSMIRGALIRRYLGDHTLPDVAGDPECQRLFFSGATRYLHAYPCDADRIRTLPTPRSWLIYKNARFDQQPAPILYDASHGTWNEDTWRAAEAETGDQLRLVSEPFCTLMSDWAQLYRPERSIAVHVQRDPLMGRATAERGAVFQYDALAAGQWFAGVILLDDDTDAPTIEQLCQPGVIWLGRSRSANYGKARITCEQPVLDWREIAGDAPAIPADHICVITLLSDALLRDGEGSPVTALDRSTLETYLGVEIARIDLAHSFTAGTELGGFNRTWRSPTVQTCALVAGCVITFAPSQPIGADVVRRIEQQGIGERRAEGFGRLAFNWQTEPSLRAGKGQRYTEQPLSGGAPSEAARRLADTMARRTLAARIDEAIIGFVKVQIVDNHALGDIPENSQLARLRVLIRRALPTGDVGLVGDGFRRFKSTARQQFERARMEGRTLAEWIESLLDQPETVTRKLDFQAPVVAGYEVSFDAALERVTALRLLTAILAALAKRQEQEQFV